MVLMLHQILAKYITSFSGKTFLVEGNASNVSQGFVYISLGGTDLQIVVNSSGSFKYYVTIVIKVILHYLYLQEVISLAQ